MYFKKYNTYLIFSNTIWLDTCPNKIICVCQSSTQGTNPSERADGDAESIRCFSTFWA